MTTPLAFGRHVAAPEDTVKGNVKVVEFGLFGGSTCASPTGASASAAVNIAVVSFMENLRFLLGAYHPERLVGFEAAR
jgi:hypothetical protein